MGESVYGWIALSEWRANPLSCNVNKWKALLRQQEICLRLLNNHDGHWMHFILPTPPITRIACNYTPVNCAFAALWIWGCGRTGIWSSVDKSRTMGDCSTKIDLGENSKVTLRTQPTNLSIPFENGVLVIGNVGLGCLQRINSHYKGIIN